MNLVTSLLVALAALVAVALLIVRAGPIRRAPRLDAAGRAHLAGLLPWYSSLDRKRRDRLCRRTARIVRDVELIGAAGLSLTESQKLAIAGQIGLVCLGAQATEARLPQQIMVYADDLAGVDDPPSGGVIEDIGELATGDDWQAVHMRLAWPAIAAALTGAAANPIVRNLAYLQDFSAATHATTGNQAWGDALEIERQALDGPGSRLIPSADALDIREFFGRAAEVFFQRGDALAADHPELYGLLAAYFDLETARRRPTGHRAPARLGRA